MHRFFVPPEWIANQQVILSGAVAHQMSRVLRMRPGERVILLDDSGWEFETELRAVKPDRIEGWVLNNRLAQGEPLTKISLYQGVLKGSSLEIVLQKATELGVVEFVPLITARAIGGRLDDARKKRQRWERIVLEAAEQSGRGRLPRLQEPMLFPGACARARRTGGLALLPWEEAQSGSDQSLKQSLREAGPFAVHLFIGPEGGFTQEEVDLARRHSILAVTLGKRVLRAETAAIVAVAVILHELGDLD